MPHMIDLNEFAGGALQEKLSIEMQRVAQNIQDPNTSHKVKRTITVKIDIAPDEEREIALGAINIESKLAPTKGIGTKFIIDQDNTGKSVIAELKSNAKGQLMIDGNGNVADDKGRTIDTATGEIQDNKVVAFR